MPDNRQKYEKISLKVSFSSTSEEKLFENGNLTPMSPWMKLKACVEASDKLLNLIEVLILSTIVWIRNSQQQNHDSF